MKVYNEVKQKRSNVKNLTEPMKEELTRLVERMWQDVAGLPWQDATWVNNQQLKDKTKTHYVSSTLEDLLKIMEANKNGKAKRGDD